MTQEDELRRDLIDTAKETAALAYAPYSNFHVGAAALTTSRQIVRGCNVENASYGLTLCAECSMISDMVQHAAGRLTHVVVCSPDGEVIPPCGRCRQLLVEHMEPGAQIVTPDGWAPLADLLPGAFLPSSLI